MFNKYLQSVLSCHISPFVHPLSKENSQGDFSVAGIYLGHFKFERHRETEQRLTSNQQNCLCDHH